MDGIKLIYAGYIAGLIMWQYSTLHYLFLVVRNRVFIRRDLKRVTHFDARKYGRVGNHINMALDASGMSRILSTPETFYVSSMLLGAGTTMILSIVESLSVSLTFGALVGILPYLVVMARLHSQRSARSKEGDIMILELLNNYKICGFNMKEAVELTAISIESAPNAKGLFLNLSKGLNVAVTEVEVKQLLIAFKYSIDTTWGNALASNIFFAHVNGIRVDSALEDLVDTMMKSRKIIEYGKRENNEARLMLKYLAPISFGLTVVGACKYFNFTLGKFIQYQFATSTGLKWFLIVVVCYLCGVFANEYFSREKMDI